VKGNSATATHLFLVDEIESFLAEVLQQLLQPFIFFPIKSGILM
jgi:hypothetical protein